ncbi:hypothetical protein FACS1894214_5190 [Planctomycetales bacterium]|nr:hypothetical protein FACS1894214_5190 [Planctomycetales bacterium]
MFQYGQFSSFVRRDVPLAMYTRLQLGGAAEFFAEPSAEEELFALLKHCRSETVPVRVIGSGSNVLASEKGVSGVVLSLAAPAFCGISIQGQNVTAGAGAKLGQLITAAVSQGLSGLEEFIGIPGTVGGALRGNTKVYCGSGIGEWVESVTVADFDGNRRVLSHSSASFGNQPDGLENQLLLSAVFRLDKDDAVLLSKRMQKNWIVRKSHQPTGEAASACAFVNPVPGGISAAELIEQNGLKGMKIGGVSVSERNAAFILAEPEATVSDVLRLLKLVQEQVRKRTDIDLAYLDPPYNQHPYGSNYFMLNLVLENKRPESASKISGIPDNWNRSAYNKPHYAYEALRDLVENIKAKYVLISFNSEGFIGQDEMMPMLKKNGKVEVLETNYNTFRGCRNLCNRKTHVSEYLYLLEK